MNGKTPLYLSAAVVVVFVGAMLGMLGEPKAPRASK